MSGGTSRAAIPAAPTPGPQLDDRAAVVLAIATWIGARTAAPVPLLGALALVAVAIALRRPWVLVAGAALLASALGARSLAGLDDPPVGPVDLRASLVADPQAGAHGASAEVRVAGRRLLVRADDGAAGSLLAARAGEDVRVVGRAGSRGAGSAWMVPRHLAGVIEARSVERVGSGGAVARAANRIRSLAARSAEGFDPTDRALYLGFVLGDDRDQPPEVVDDFRGTGLSHLMVVSGQNLAFAMVLLAPLSRRLGWPGRWAMTAGVALGFVVVTRFEPSVLRAGAMAVVAVSGQLAGRPAPAWRNLCLAVAAMVLIDPLLTRSVGFQLSAAATGAIALAGPPLAAVLPGPRWLAVPFATSAAAQLGVTPILLGFAGGAPVASVPANVLAGPAAGVVTTYGLPVGLVGGLVGGSVAEAAHLPTVVAIGWVAAVARVGASLPLGELGLGHLAALVGCAAVARSRGAPAVAAALVAGAVLLAPAVALRSPPGEVLTPSGSRIWRDGAATVVEARGGGRIDLVLRDLRRAGVRRIDALVVAGPGDALAATLRHRWRIGAVVDADTPATVSVVGPFEIEARPPDDPTVRPRPP